MLAKRHHYTIYRKSNEASNEWGEVVSQKEIIKEVTGGVPQLTVVDVKEDKFISKTYGMRIVVDDLIDPTLNDIYISENNVEYRVTNIIPCETFFRKTMLYVARS